MLEAVDTLRRDFDTFAKLHGRPARDAQEVEHDKAHYASAHRAYCEAKEAGTLSRFDNVWTMKENPYA